MHSNIKIIYSKQAQKYLSKTDANTRAKLNDLIFTLHSPNAQIIELEGTPYYKLKTYHYRILFTYDKTSGTITIKRIGPRGDIYKGGL